MIRIAISVAAFEAIARTMPLGSVGYDAEANERGERYVGLPPNVVDRLSAMRGPSYSDVILRLSEGGGLAAAARRQGRQQLGFAGVCRHCEYGNGRGGCLMPPRPTSHAFVRVHARERQPRLERLANSWLKSCCGRSRLPARAKWLLIHATHLAPGGDFLIERGARLTPSPTAATSPSRVLEVWGAVRGPPHEDHRR
jgi:hypothetical protein